MLIGVMCQLFLTIHPIENQPKKLLEHVKDQIRLKHYFYLTEETYILRIHRYILLHHKRHPQEMGVTKIEAFLSHLGRMLGVRSGSGCISDLHF
jgi:hypothetical protein